MTIAVALYGQEDPPTWVPWVSGSPPDPVTGFAWIDVVDPREDETALLQHAFNLHDLAIEDSMSDAQPAKLDLYSDHVFLVAKIAELEGDEIVYTDISIFLAKGRVITICRTQSSFSRRLRERAARIAAHPRQGPEFVAHGVLDLIVDRYFPMLHGMADEILQMERRLMCDRLHHADIERIFRFRRETVHFQHVVSRMTEVCNKLATIDLPCVSEGARPYFRDVLDNLMRIEAMGAGLMDVIRAAFEASNLIEQQRQSEITRQLAGWASILGVPTAMAGIYGMNFANLPGTGSEWGYLVALGVMGSASALLYWRFRALGWLRPSRRKVTTPGTGAAGLRG